MDTLCSPLISAEARSIAFSRSSMFSLPLLCRSLSRVHSRPSSILHLRAMSSGTTPVVTHPQLSLPTLTKLESTVHADVSPVLVASEWLQSFTSAIGSNDTKKLGALFLQDAFWKDILALSWDYRSIQGVSRILPFVETCAPKNGLTISSIAEDPYRSPKLLKLFPDLSWIQFGFALETNIGKGNGFARLVPTSSGEWKAYTVFTSLETLAGEKVGYSFLYRIHSGSLSLHHPGCSESSPISRKALGRAPST